MPLLNPWYGIRGQTKYGEPGWDHIKAMKRVISWPGGNKPDEIAQRVEEAVAKIEAVCRPVIEDTSQRRANGREPVGV